MMSRRTRRLGLLLALTGVLVWIGFALSGTRRGQPNLPLADRSTAPLVMRHLSSESRGLLSGGVVAAQTEAEPCN